VQFLPLADEACLLVQQQLLKVSSSRTLMAFKPHIHSRIIHLPRTSEIIRETVSSILSRDVGHVVQVPGTVVRTGMLKMLEHSRRYRCGKCFQEKEVAMDVEMRNATLAPPSFCVGQGAGPDGLCGGKTFSKVEGSEMCRDYQEIKIQEQVQHLGIGSMPRGIMVLLHDDLVDSCKPGDDVRITGVPMRRWKPLVKGTRADAELVIVCNSVDVAQDKGSSSCAIRSASCARIPFPSHCSL
jgi:DNA helicase MCM9